MKTRNKIIIYFIIVLIVFASQIIKDIDLTLSTSNLGIKDWYWNLSYVKSNSPAIADNPLIYTNDRTKVNDLYVVILPTLDSEDNPITFEFLNSITDYKVEKPILNAYVVNTDLNGKSNDNIEAIPNATITLRGHSTMLVDQKSYKIKLNKGTFMTSNILNLNKHPYDSYKVRNKIAFELFESIPNFTSMKTNLVNLYIKDMTNSKDGEFMDYGLFTNIEQANKKFLKDHKLDTEGYLYKAEFFEYFRYEEIIRNIDDPLYDEIAFSEALEPKVAKDHKKIIKMLEDVNNENLNINKVLDRHFNRDNYFTWLAINILLANYDTQSQNYFLYSSHDNLAWYFLPWDYDGSMGEDLILQYDSDGKFQALVGVSNYWNNVLHKRVFMEPNNLTELNNKINEISSMLSKDLIEEIVMKYYPIVKKEYDSNPLFRDKLTIEEFNKQPDYIINTVENNRNLYYENIEKPMPVYLGDMEKVGNIYYFFWDESFDLQGDRLSYTFQISKTPNFSDVIFEKKRLRNEYYELELELEPGEYYWRVIIVDSKGNTQRAFDQIINEDYTRYFGLKKIVIE